MNQITLLNERTMINSSNSTLLVLTAYMLALEARIRLNRQKVSEYAGKKTVPIWHKYLLTIEEAAEYFGIGEKRLRRLANESMGAEYVMEVGSQIRFKRVLLEAYLDGVYAI